MDAILKHPWVKGSVAKQSEITADFKNRKAQIDSAAKDREDEKR
jgi:hypothetical protein